MNHTKLPREDEGLLIKRDRLGWLQSSILVMLWNTEMYGLEIGKRLALRGVNIETGQLYPALNHLEKVSALSSKEELHATTVRKYYKTTALGKEMVMQSLLNFIFLFEDMIADKVFPIIEKGLTMAGIRAGMLVADFSSVHYDSLVKTLAQQVGPDGRLLSVAHSEALSSIFAHRVQYFGIENSTISVKQEQGKVPIADHTVDAALLVFTLHEDGTEWTVKEIARVLKPTGTGIVVDVLRSDQGDSFFEMILEEFTNYLPRHSRYGISYSELKSVFDKNELKINSEETVRGIIIFRIQPKKKDEREQD